MLNRGHNFKWGVQVSTNGSWVFGVTWLRIHRRASSNPMQIQIEAWQQIPLICVSQDFLWRNLQSGSSWQTSDSTNSSTNCQLVHGFAASIYFEKARIAFYFIIFHGVSQQRYLRNLTNFRNQANTSRLLCYVFFACMLTNTYQLRWANNWAKRKRGAFSIQPISILLQYFDIYKSYLSSLLDFKGYFFRRRILLKLLHTSLTGFFGTFFLIIIPYSKITKVQCKDDFRQKLM